MSALVSVLAIDPTQNRVRVQLRAVHDGVVCSHGEADLVIDNDAFWSFDTFKEAINTALMDHNAKLLKAQAWRGIDWPIDIPGET